MNGKLTGNGEETLTGWRVLLQTHRAYPIPSKYSVNRRYTGVYIMLFLQVAQNIFVLSSLVSVEGLLKLVLPPLEFYLLSILADEVY